MRSHDSLGKLSLNGECALFVICHSSVGVFPYGDVQWSDTMPLRYKMNTFT